MRWIFLAALLTAAAGTFAGELAEFHSRHAKAADFRNSRSHEEVQSTNHGISEIGIERTLCFGTCPVYTFIAKSDGTCRYRGESDVQRTGSFTGTIPVGRFHDLALFLRDSGFMELDDDYSRLVTDLPTTFTTVVMNGKRKVIRNYANAGPTKLWAAEQLIDQLMSYAQWTNASAPARP